MDKLSHEVSELKQQMERLALALARSGAGMAGIASDPELSKIFATLTQAELDADMAYDVAAQVGTPATTEALRAVLGRLIRTDHELGGVAARPRTVALIGPPWFWQNHHAGQAGGPIRHYRAQARTDSEPGHIPDWRRRRIALLCFHSGNRFPDYRDYRGAGAGP